LPLLRAESQVRQPQRDARQGRRPHVLAAAGRVIDVRTLTDVDVERIGDRLPLHRLGGHQTYLVAWDGDEPVGHAHIAWTGGKLGAPEVGDVFVVPAHRRRGIATELMAAAEREAAARGHARISLGHSIGSDAARRLYEGLGYRNAGLEPERVKGTIVMRGRAVEVDDTLIHLVKDLAVDSGGLRSS
jgi:GNAT superfamily N-acetyltransferase